MKTELEMQENILKALRKKKINKHIQAEFPLHHGTADIFFKREKWNYFVEIKLRINEKVFEQVFKHLYLADFMIIITFKPKTQKTETKWEKKARKMKINLFWYENINKLNQEMEYTNPNRNKTIERMLNA